MLRPAPVIEPFTGTNGDDLPTYSANWSNVTGANPMEIQGNAATGTTNAAINIGVWNAETYGPDVQQSIIIGTKPGTGLSAMVMARLVQEGATSTIDGYGVRLTQRASSDDDVEIIRVDNGVFTVLGALIDQEFAAGDGLAIQCINDQILAWYWNQTSWTLLGSRTDATYTAAGRVGLYTTSTTVRLDSMAPITIPQRLLASKFLRGGLLRGGLLLR